MSQSPKDRQQALNNIPEADLAKIRAINSARESVKVEAEDLLLAEFALKFGWEAYRDAKEDKISLEEILTLMAASQKIDYKNLYLAAQASYIGCGSSNSKSPSATFKKMTDGLIKEMKADE